MEKLYRMRGDIVPIYIKYGKKESRPWRGEKGSVTGLNIIMMLTLSVLIDRICPSV